jgi:C4-type Zn-finger protein
MKKETHKELIICPECQHQGYGTVIHTEPFFTYIHVCKACEYVITESDWEVVKP